MRSALLLGTVLATALTGQTISLALSSGSGAPGGVVTLPLTLTASGSQPVGLQWTFGYSATDVTSIDVTGGPAALAAGKSVQCSAGSGSVVCILTGLNSTIISNGVVATATVRLSASASGSMVPVSVTGALGVTALGGSVPGTASGAAISLSSAPAGAPASLSAVACTPSTITTPGTTSCLVSLSGPAPAGGAVVSVSPSVAQLAVPAVVSIPAGASSVSFTATASALQSEIRASLQASYKGLAVASFVMLLPGGTSPGSASPGSAVSISALSCSPALITTPGSAVCTVTLSGAAPSTGAAVSLSSSASQVAVAPSITVAAGATSATFTANASAVTASTPVSLTASYGGTSGTAALTLAPGGVTSLSSIACTPLSVTGAGTTSCTVTLSGPAPAGGAVVSVSPSIAQLTVPAKVSIPAGATSASFTATASAVQSAVRASLQASYKGTTVAGFVTLLPAPGPSISSIGSIDCTPSSPVAGSIVPCSVTLSDPAPAAGRVVSLTSSSVVATVPATLTVPAGSSTVSFSMTLAPSPQTTATITADADGATRAVTFAIQALKVATLVCTPTSVPAGGVTACKATLNTNVATNLVLSNAASKNIASVPATVSVPAGSNSANYIVYAKSGTTGSVTITSNWGGSSGSSVLSIVSNTKAAMSLSSEMETPYLDSVTSAADPGAAAACSPGAVATLSGSRLSEEGAADLDINGQPARILSASPTQVIFECPDVAPQTELLIRLRSTTGESNVLRTVTRELAPAIFTVGGTQAPFGLILTVDESPAVAIRAPEVEGTAATPGQVLSIFCTGLGRSFGSDGELATALPVVTFDGAAAEVVSASAAGNGLYRVDVRVPDHLSENDRTSLKMEVSETDGHTVRSNEVYLSIAH